MFPSRDTHTARPQKSPYFFCVLKYARTVKQKVWSEAENGEGDWGAGRLNLPSGECEASGRKNVMSMRELFCPYPLAGFEKMVGFQNFFCLKIKCFHS